MGLGDKISNKAEELMGKGKAEAGDATDNPNLEAEGRAEEAGAETKQAGDNVADALRDASAAMKGDSPMKDDDDERHMRF
jgi:uncharacterized protein YjbJ (UPF0337 family)